MMPAPYANLGQIISQSCRAFAIAGPNTSHQQAHHSDGKSRDLWDLTQNRHTTHRRTLPHYFKAVKACMAAVEIHIDATRFLALAKPVSDLG